MEMPIGSIRKMYGPSSLIYINMDYRQSLLTPIGYLQVIADEEGICRILFSDHSEDASAHTTSDLVDAINQLKQYFRGERRLFDLKLSQKGTEFQMKVWEAISKIPFGEICSYKELAEQLHHPGASRAVGLANNRNALPIIIPCHRVIGSSGKLVGYAGDIWRKNWLLQHEKNMLMA